jgi:hypothetical protein
VRSTLKPVDMSTVSETLSGESCAGPEECALGVGRVEVLGYEVSPQLPRGTELGHLSSS